MLTFEQIAQEAKSLSKPEKLQLVDALLSDVHEIDPEIEAYWAKVADERYEEYKKGNVELIDWEDIKREFYR